MKQTDEKGNPLTYWGGLEEVPEKYASYCCQRCGECIGWLGRFNEWIYGLIGFKNIIHKCKNK